jgi:hypothetical protein
MASESFESGRAALPDETTERQPARAAQLHPTSELPEVPTGTGWPEAESPGVATRAKDDFRAGDDSPARRWRGGGCLFWLAGLVALIVIAGLGLRASGLWPHFNNPFAEKTTDRSGPVLLKSIQDLSRFEAASGNFQQVIDVQQNRSMIPDIIFNDRTLFICIGSVDAYVDFTTIGAGAITESADHKTIEVRLPAPQLEKPNIDHEKSYVFATQEGLINRIGNLFGGDPDKQRRLYLLGEQRIAVAARDSGLSDRAAENTQKMLTQLLRSLGYTAITVKFAAT